MISADANSVHLPSKSSCSAGTGGHPQRRVRWGRGKLNAEVSGVSAGLGPMRTEHPFCTQVHRELTARQVSTSCSHTHYPTKSLQH